MPRQIRQKFLLALLLLLLPSAIVAQQTGNMFPVSLLYPGGGNNIIQASDGMLYGTSVDDGYDGGIIFQIDPTTGTYKKIYAFNSVTDGEVPNSIVEGSDGELYGTNIYGGNNGGQTCGAGFACGTVFKVSTAGKFTLLHTFTGNSDGYNPSGGLVQGADGYYYGVNEYGGGPAMTVRVSYNGGCGTVFRVSSTGDFSVVYTFLVDGTTGVGPGGGYPIGNLVQASDGNFYANATLFNYDTQYDMVEPSFATIFSVSPGGSEATVYTSTLPENSSVSGNPAGLAGFSQLVEGSDGNLYGTARLGGSSQGTNGAVFNMSFAGDLTTLVEFPAAATGTAKQPNGALALGGDGNFYGSLSSAGANGCGTVFSMAPGGALTDLFDLYSIDGCGPGSFVPGSAPGQFFDVVGGVYIDQLTVSPSTPAPVQLTLTQPVITIGGSTTLNWQVLNAFSLTFQQCYAFSTFEGGVNPLGKLPGTLANNIFSGTVPITPPLPGTYALAITCGGQESGFATLTVNKATTTAVLTSSRTDVVVGQPLTFTTSVAKVSPLATPTGSVTFYYGSVALATVAVTAQGTAAFTVGTGSLPAGSYTLKAVYSGDTFYNAATSGNVTVTLTGSTATTTTLKAPPSPVVPPANITLTATVAHATGSAAPTGTVTFYYQTFSLGSVTLKNGTAAVSIGSAGLPAGSYAVTATYSGDANYAASSSLAATVTVQ